MHNTFGRKFSFTSFGESHTKVIACVVDGVPAGLKIDENFIQNELNRRKPGLNKYSSPRKEDDKAEILSGVFEGLSTGTPIAILIYNNNIKSKDYSNIKDIFRPSHADFTYFHKYGLRDYRGGGRSSARETAARVCAGAIAKLILNELNIKILSGVYELAGIKCKTLDFDYAKRSEIYSLDKLVEAEQKQAILEAKKNSDSLGAVALIKATNVPIGLGEPIYYKLDAILSSALMSINATKAIEIGEGFNSARIKGSVNNDQMDKKGFLTNKAGGILGGISSGEDIDIKLSFKPTPSISKTQKSIDINNKEEDIKIKGRHDPCVGIRGSIVAEAMTAIVITDMLLLNLGRQIKGLKNYYGY